MAKASLTGQAASQNQQLQVQRSAVGGRMAVIRAARALYSCIAVAQL